MSYHLKLFSERNDDFQRIIAISPEDTFLILHNAICTALGLDATQLSSFYLCDDRWNDTLEITLEDMSFDENNVSPLMGATTLEEHLLMKGFKLRYLNDYIAMNEFRMELIEDEGKDKSGLKLPSIIYSDGDISSLGLGKGLDLDGIDDELIKKLQLENFDRFSSFDESLSKSGFASLDDEDFEDEDDEDEDHDEFGGFDDFGGGGGKGGRRDSDY